MRDDMATLTGVVSVSYASRNISRIFTEAAAAVAVIRCFLDNLSKDAAAEGYAEGTYVANS